MSEESSEPNAEEEHQEEPKEEKKDKTQKKRKRKRRKRNRLRGFPGIIWNQLKVLNDSDYFKENYAEDDFSILIIATDMRRAALVISKGGKVKVESVVNKPEEIKPAKKKADGRIETQLETLMGVITKKVNPVKAILKRELKIGGLFKVLKFIKYFKVVSHISKQKEE